MDTSKMTDEEIGRIVAEKVMDWELWKDFMGWVPKTALKPITLNDVISKHLWNPCQNIEQAFRVVEKMAEMGYRFEIYRWSDGDMHNFNKWGCKFESGDIEFCTYSDNPARAICEAALKAVEE